MHGSAAGPILSTPRPTRAGMEESDIWTCVNWLAPFVHCLRCNGPIQMKQFYGPPVVSVVSVCVCGVWGIGLCWSHLQVHSSDSHNIQTHVVNLQMLEHTQLQRRQMEGPHRLLPVSSVMMTPPHMDKQHRALGELSNILV